MGRLAVAFTLAAIFVTFQNFSNVPLELLKPRISTAQARVVSPTDGRADMRDLAPKKPDGEEEQILVTPQSGNDLDSIGQDWMTRQTNAITGGAEQKILDKMNKRMNRWVNGEGTGSPKASGHASAVPRTERIPSSDGGASSIRPRNVHFSRVNKMDMDLALDTHLSCQYKGNSVQWDLSRNVIGDVDVNIRHDSRDSANSIHLQYHW